MSKVSTSFELNQLDSYIKGIDTAQKRLDDFAAKTNNSFANLKPPSVSTPKIDAELKAATQQIKLYEAERLDIAKSSSLAVRALYKAETDAFKSEENAKLRAQKQSVKDFESALKSSSGGFGSSFTSRVGISSDFGSAAFLGGLAGGAAVAGIGILKTELSSLTSTAEDLTVASIKLAGNFEETTNAVAVFAGGTANARRELAAIDKIALNTPGLKLQDAEAGYQRLRALNFEAKISQDLIKGLGTQRVLSGATSDAVDRVVTNLIQLKTGAGTAADVRQTIGQLPTLLPVFQKAFGTQDFGDINKIFKTDPQALQKFSDELAKAQTAQVGLNVSIEKGADAVTQAGRSFGQPILDPLTKDVQGLTKLVNENQDTFARWGQFVGDTIRGVSEVQKANGVTSQSRGLGNYISATTAALRFGIAAPLTAGLSEAAIGTVKGLAATGEAARRKQELEESQKSFSELVGKNGGLEVTTASGLVVGAVGAIGKEVLKIPSLAKQLQSEEAKKDAEKLAENIRKVSGEIAEFGIKSQIDTGSQNLEISKAIAVRNAKGDGLKIAKDTAALEIANLKEQILLSDKLFAAKTQNLSSDDFKAGKGLLLSRENEANVNKLNSQILLTQINSQNQISEKIKETVKTAASLYEDLSVRANADNPFVSLFIEADREARKLKETVKNLGLNDEFAKAATALQSVVNSNKQFETRLGNKLAAQDLRDDADNFRNFNRYKPDNYQSVIDGSLSGKTNPFGFGKTYAQFVQEGNGKNPLTKEQQNDVFNVETFNALTRNGVDAAFGIQYLGKVRGAALGTEDLTLQQRLDKKIDLITSSNPVNADQRATAERALISLTQGIDPSKLSSNERDVAAAARENEAVRREAYEKNATALLERVAISNEALLAQGKNGVNVTVKDETAAGVEAKQQTKTAGRDDVESHYNLGTNKVGNRLTSF